MGINYLMICSEDYVRFVNGSTIFSLVKRIGPFHIFRCEICHPVIYAGNMSSIELIQLSAEDISFRASIKSISEDVIIRLIYYPGFKAKVDERKVHINLYKVGVFPFMSIKLGRGIHLVELDYKRLWPDIAGEILTKFSGITLIVMISMELLNKRHKN